MEKMTRKKNKNLRCIVKVTNHLFLSGLSAVKTDLVCIFLQFFVMKKQLLFIVPLCLFLYACPYESSVPLSAQPAEAVDTSLLGYWYGIVKDGSDYFGIEALDITRHSDSVYAITRYGKAIKGDIILPDTAYFTGYITHAAGQRFMNVESAVLSATLEGQDPQVRVQNVYYISRINRSNDTLTVQTITEKFTSSRKVFNTPLKLHEEVKTLISNRRNIYDDLYSLSYRKIIKPRSFH